jgi:hypothetical protein
MLRVECGEPSQSQKVRLFMEMFPIGQQRLGRGTKQRTELKLEDLKNKPKITCTYAYPIVREGEAICLKVQPR